MFIFVYRVRRQTPIGQLMSVYYASLALWQLDQTYRYSLHPAVIGTWSYQLVTAFGFSLAFGLVEITYLQFLYQFLYHPFRRESKLVLIMSVGLMIGLLSLNIWNEFFNHSDLHILELGGFGYGLIANFWALLVCWRKGRYLRRRDAQAAQAYKVLVGVNIGFVTTSVVAVMFGFYSLVGYWTFFLTVWIGNLVQVVVYITYAAVPTSFQVKIAGFSFVTVVTFLTVVTLVFFPPVLPNDLPARLGQQPGLTKMFIIIIGATIFVAVVLPRLLRQSLTTPLQRLMLGVQQVNAGNLNTSVAVGTPDEIGVLTTHFNQMTQSLRRANEDLTTYTYTLEQKVAERTAELTHQSAALEQSLAHLKATQTQLIHAEKMASLGELTAGIAHEIQNPLNFVNNFSEISIELVDELADEQPDPDQQTDLLEQLKANLRKITQHGQRASNIVRGMLDHSRSLPGEPQWTDLNALVDEYLRLAYQGLRAKDQQFNCKLVTNLDPRLSPVRVIPQDIGRVLLNLFMNAFQAVQQRQQQAGSDYQPTVTILTRFDHDQAHIIVRDNGVGIPEAIKQKIFQPFFTTKPTGEGTGLGLSLSYDIITKGHRGTLAVDSGPGQATEFSIRLPISDRDPPSS